MRVAIVGNLKKLPTESYQQQYERIVLLIEKAIADANFQPTEIITGKKNGVDRAAILYAELHALPKKSFDIRFSVIANADALIAIGDGTHDVIQQMSRDGKLVHIVRKG